MKKLRDILFFTLFGLISLNSHCPGHDDDDDDPAPLGETQSKKMEGTWTVDMVTSNGSEFLAGNWTNFELTFSNAEEGTDEVWGGDFSSSGRPSSDYLIVWPQSGTWKFTSVENVSEMVRDDDIEIKIISGETLLTLEFRIHDANFGGRTSGIDDTIWNFVLKKKV